ncbi:MAG: glucose-1-phosphate thymidylyltransferase [Chloroflexi bacterium]|nr:glucose-1-phosphate thymidylyltransferase [Chloroflexota bacterium]
MKGLVLSGGKGTRLRPFTHTGAKQLVPLANKPVLFYVLEDLVTAGVRDIGIVVGNTADQIQAAVGDGSAFGCHVTYIYQDHPGGLAHAVRTAYPFLGEDKFVMYLGDNFIQGGIARYAEEFRSSDAAAHLLLYRTSTPQQFGVAEVEDGRIVGLEEKPAVPRSDLALVGIYFFDRRIHQATEAIKPSWRGELEITDAIGHLLASGEEVRPHVLEGWWIDTGKMEDMLDANRLVLQDMPRRLEGTIAEDCTVQGNVVMEMGATAVGSTLRGPLIVGAGTRIEHAYIGPFTAIGADCLIRDSEIEHSIVMERSQILGVPYRIEDSLIGRDVTVVRSMSKPKALKVMLGDHSKVGIV